MSRVSCRRRIRRCSGADFLADNKPVAAGSKSIVLGSQGTLNVELGPNAGAIRAEPRCTGGQMGQRPASTPASFTPLFLTDLFAPVLQGFLNQSHELVGDGAVDHAMVVTEREVHQ